MEASLPHCSATGVTHRPGVIDGWSVGWLYGPSPLHKLPLQCNVSDANPFLVPVPVPVHVPVPVRCFIHTYVYVYVQRTVPLCDVQRDISARNLLRPAPK